MRSTVTEVSSCSQRSKFRDFTSNLQRAAANSSKKCACAIHTHIASAAYTLAAVQSIHGMKIRGTVVLSTWKTPRTSEKHAERTDLFVLNLCTRWCKNRVDRADSFCATVVRATHYGKSLASRHHTHPHMQ